ncbi:MAG: alpha/beta hydrolase [Hydrogenophaga sp.]|uniref:Alpha/beta hydrolase n=1 Tax=Hydrogenophaga crocea TaxID=2716225 RepID=A0A6G8IJ96_9BURK|nr:MULTISPECIES: alpha/beta hydrolase [Hydrogenophaga]MBL0945512.1 alpha/beta hydrolase [Hydrogenophaga sp.]QIM53264.1 alpha/beta hydrolase [Hydrogenophaga crocea]
MPDLIRRGLTALGLLPLLQACSPLRVIDALVPSDTHTRVPDQAYGPDPRQRLDVYLPARPLPQAPIAVFFYGGSWTTGERADYRFAGEALASRGIVTVVPDYRLSPAVRYPGFVRDSALALHWAREHAREFGADPERLYVTGHSAGAYNAAMLALDPRWLGEVGLQPGQLAGWAGLAGPYDFLPIVQAETRVAFEWPDTPPDSQPLFHAQRLRGAAPPALLLAPQKDPLVDPRRNTEALAAALQARGVPVQHALLPRVNHATLVATLAPPLRPLAPTLERLAGFMGVPPQAQS